MRILKLLLAAAFTTLVLTGCINVPLTYQPTMQNLETLKSNGMQAASVGKFALAPGKPSSMDKEVSVRGSTVTSSIDDSFAAFLRDAVTQELRAAGKYDAQSPLVINGLLTLNELEAPIGTGKGALGARFSVARAGSVVYEKELQEKAEWPSSFVGADAIPTAMTQYATLYKKLLNKLFGDEEFRKATQAK